MSSNRLVAVLLAVSAIAPLAQGCAGGGGSGGGGGASAGTVSSAATAGSGGAGGTTSSSSTSTGTSTSTSTSTSTASGTDRTPPTYTIISPARGEFVSGAAQVTVAGTADDAQSGVARVEVNGQAATLAGSSFSAPATLTFGTNIFTLRVLDNAGNSAHTSWSVIYSPSYLAPAQLVENSAGVRLSAKAVAQLTPLVVNAMTAGGLLQQAIASAAGTSAGGAQINSLTFGTPQVAVSLVQGGLRTVIDIPNIDVDARFVSIPFQFSATNARVDAVILISVRNGAFVASMPTQPTVSFTGFTSSLGSGMKPVVEQALAVALQAALPPALTAALNQAVQPRTFTVAGVTATFEARPRTLAIDPANVRTMGDANVTISTGTAPRQAPGSPSRNGATTAAPTFASARDVSVALREDFLNRVVFAAWQSSAGRFRIDQQFLAAQGIQLPVPLDASLLVPFFPVLATLKPGGGPMPLALELNPTLPPVVEVTGAPSLLTTGVGELHLSIQMDLGQGYVDVLTLAVHVRMGTSVSISQNQVRIVPGQPSQVAVDLLQNPFGLALPDVNRFLQTTIPLLVNLAGAVVPPIPLPPLPGGIQPTNIDIRQDGAGGDFVTIEGSL